MDIMICDDESQELDKLYSILNIYAKDRQELDLEIYKFDKAFDLIDAIAKKGAPDIVFLDICMPGILGTELAREIKTKYSNETEIVFLTNSSDYAVEAYTIHATDYIKKPYEEKTIIQTLDRIIENRKTSKFVLIKCETEIQKIDLFSVIYAEATHGFIEIHTKSKVCLKSRLPLTKFIALFNDLEGFSAVGASYFINFRFVNSISQDFLEMSSGDVLPIPRRSKAELKSKIFDFYKTKMLEE